MVEQKTYTAFCHQANGEGTIWISQLGPYEGEQTLDSLADDAIRHCAADWDSDPHDVLCIGIAEGDINILMWDDSHL